MTYSRTKRHLHAAAVAVLAASGIATPAQTQSWPARTVTAVIPLSAGNAIDVVGRAVLEQVSRQIGQPIVVENRAGAGGTLGANAVAKAAPDGYTILIHSSSFAAANAVYATLPYDTVKDFAPVIALGNQPSVLVTAPAKGFKTLGDLVAYAKANPGKLNFASAGVGSASHFAAERFRLAAGFQAQHVPFRGPNEALTDVVAGRVDFYFLPLAPALPMLRDGKLVALAVSTPKRTAALPDVPTTVESGLKDSSYLFWTGMFVHAQTPKPIVERLYEETRKAMATDVVKERFARLAVEPFAMTQAEFEKFFRDDLEATTKLVKDAGIPRTN
jgi:tripartite-type tricarboxylate transporter receptor subunit TctC